MDAGGRDGAGHDTGYGSHRNSIGNVGGFFGPAIVGWLKDATGSYSGGLYGLALFTLVSAVTAALGLHIPRRFEQPEALQTAAE